MICKYWLTLQPPEDLETKLRGLRAFVSDSILKVPSYLHCTLMLARMNDREEQAITNSLDGLVLSSFDAELGDYVRFRSNMLGVHVSSPELKQLHLEIIERLRPFLNYNRPVSFEKDFITNERRMEVSRTYGSPYYAEFFNPHISLCKLHPSFFSRRVKDMGLPPLEMKWKVEGYFLFKRRPQEKRYTHLKRFGLICK